MATPGFLQTCGVSLVEVASGLSCSCQSSSSSVLWRIRGVVGFDTEARDKFLDEFKEFAAEPANLVALLTPMRTSTDHDTFSSQIGRDSVAQILLSVDCIQTDIALMLLERLPEFCQDEEDSDQANLKIAELILSQFKWIHRVVDARKISARMLECLTILPPKLQHTVIRLLRDVVSDSDQEDIVASLKALMLEEHTFIPTVLETLGSLSLPQSLQDEVLEAVYPLLSSAPVHHLPTVLNFLLHAATKANSGEIISQIRDSLDLVPVEGSVSMSQKSQSREGEGDVFVLETLRSGLQFHKDVASAFAKQIERVDDAKQMKTVDVWILWVLWASELHHALAKRLIRKKVSSGHLTTPITRSAISGHVRALTMLFSSLVELASSSVQSIDAVHKDYGADLYILLFSSFTDRSNQISVVENLITHLGSGSSPEMDCALRILVTLADTHARSLAAFAGHLKHTLDFLDSFSNSQLRSIFHVFFSLSQQAVSRSLATDDLRVLIRKQLAASNIEDKRIGIVGGLACIRCFASSTGEDRHPPNEEAVAEAQQMWAELVVACEVSPTSKTFLYDELALMVKGCTLGSLILQHLGQHMETTFAGSVDDFVEGDPVPTPAGCDLSFDIGIPNLDGKDAPVCLQVSPALWASTGPATAQNLLVTVGAVFKAMAITTKQNHGNLSDVDAALGMPVIMFNLSSMASDTFEQLQPSCRELVCMSLMCAINWVREVINAFSDQQNTAEMKNKVILRAKVLNNLESKLLELLQFFPEFSLLRSPPVCAFHSVAPKWNQKSSTSKTEDGSTKSKKVLPFYASLSSVPILSKWLRPLEIDAFSVLMCCGTDPQVAGQSEEATATIENDLILFLLHLLQAKIKTLLAPKVVSRFATVIDIPFYNMPLDSLLQPVEVVQKLTPIIGSLAKLFKQVVESDDAERRLDNALFMPWLKIVTSCLHCDGFQLEGKHQVWKQFLAIFGSTPNADPRTCVLEAFQFFSGFAEDMGNVECAVELIKLFEALMALEPAQTLQEQRMRVSEAAYLFLVAQWPENPKAVHTSLLIRVIVRYTQDPLGRMYDLVDQLLTPNKGSKGDNEDSDQDKSDDDETESPIPLKMLGSVYKALVEELSEQFDALDTTNEENDDICEDICSRVNVFGKLIAFAMSRKTQPIVSTLLRLSCSMVDCLSTKFLPVISSHFSNEKTFEICKAFIKACSRHSRRLKFLCDFGKKCADSQALKSVPQLKRGLERLIFAVKELLFAHNCLTADAFQIRNINHKLFSTNGEPCSQLVPEHETDVYRRKWGAPKPPKKPAKKRRSTSSKDDDNNEADGDHGDEDDQNPPPPSPQQGVEEQDAEEKPTKRRKKSTKQSKKKQDS